MRAIARGLDRSSPAFADAECDPPPRIVGGGPDPWHLHLLAWEYLLPGRRMTRRVDTREVHSTRWGMKRMELDVSFPSSCLTQEARAEGPPERCLIPAVFLPKEPVAMDLEVRDADGAWVAVPARRECKLLTEQAIELIGTGAADLTGRRPEDFDLRLELRQRIGDVITMDPLPARISRLHIEKRMGLQPEMRDWLLPLLRRLEDNYLLWVPLEGSPLGDHHLTISRSDRRKGEQFFWPARLFKETKIVESEAGTIEGRWKPPLRWLYFPRFPAFLGRLLLTFGLMPIKFDEETLEAHRFASYHLAMIPPPGLVVREVRTGQISEERWGEADPEIDEMASDFDRTVHGEDSRTGHVHLEMDRNPGWVNSRITIGLRPGTTTLWAMVVVLTCGLLWALRHELPRLLGLGEFTADDTDTQIVAAVLLVGPTFAASWTLRNNPTLIRSMLSGAEGLLLLSAVVSVGAALVLAGFEPFGWGPLKTVDWYASISYAIAVLVMTGWLQARSWIWSIYRHVLFDTRMNLIATAMLCGIAYLAARALHDVGVVPAVFLFAAGFGLTAVAGNRTSVDLGENSRLAAFWTGLGALVSLALAGRELGFFDLAVKSREEALDLGTQALAVVGIGALLGLVLLPIRESVRRRRKKRRLEAQAPMEIAGN